MISNTEEKDLQLKEEWEIIEEAKKDPKNFEPLYHRYYEKIYTFLINRTGDYDVANDLTSHVFLKAILKIKKYKNMGFPFHSWLYKIAINECNYHFRKQKMQRTVVLDTVNLDHLTQGLPEVELLESDKASKIQIAIQHLNPKELTAIDLRFFENNSFKEVGYILGITENNAKTRVYRAINKMKKVLERIK